MNTKQTLIAFSLTVLASIAVAHGIEDHKQIMAGQALQELRHSNDPSS